MSANCCKRAVIGLQKKTARPGWETVFGIVEKLIVVECAKTTWIKHCLIVDQTNCPSGCIFLTKTNCELSCPYNSRLRSNAAKRVVFAFFICPNRSPMKSKIVEETFATMPKDNQANVLNTYF